MTIAEKLTLIAQNEQKVYNAGYEKGKSEGGGGSGEKPTLFTPTITITNSTGELTITDDRNGDFEREYEIHKNDELLVTTTSKSVCITDYIPIEVARGQRYKVLVKGENFNNSEFSEELVFLGSTEPPEEPNEAKTLAILSVYTLTQLNDKNLSEFN